MMNIGVLKLLFCIILLSFFLFIFGKPAIERYLASKVVFRVTEMEPQPLESPAVTVCVDVVCTLLHSDMCKIREGFI